MNNIGNALKEPVRALAETAAKIETAESQLLTDRADQLVRLVDEIQLANMLENDTGKVNPFFFRAGLDR